MMFTSPVVPGPWVAVGEGVVVGIKVMVGDGVTVGEGVAVAGGMVGVGVCVGVGKLKIAGRYCHEFGVRPAGVPAGWLTCAVALA